jgi:hypothetical protein
MVMYHPSRKFEIVAVDVLEMTPVTPRGNRKALVIGDMFTRFIMALVGDCVRAAGTVAVGSRKEFRRGSHRAFVQESSDPEDLYIRIPSPN